MKRLLSLLPVALYCTQAWTAVSIIDFGAKGDGLSDDTRAIQAALDIGKNVLISEGVFRITNALEPIASKPSSRKTPPSGD